MKIYTQTYDLATPSPQRFWVAPNSDFKFGVKILSKGETTDKDFTVKAGAVELEPDEDKVDGFTTYTVKSGGTGHVEYTIEVEDVAEKLKLTQIVTDSTVFDVGSAGGGSGGDATLSATTAYTNWIVSPAKWTILGGSTYVLSAPQYGDFNYQGDPRHGWYWVNPEDTEMVYDLDSDDPTETSLSVGWDEAAGQRVNVSFSREAVVGYQLGDQSDKILADRNTVKNLVAGVVEDFGPWRVFSNDGTVVNNAYVMWQPSGNCWVMYDGANNVIGEADNGEINNNLILCEGTPDRYAYRRHTFTCPNGVEIQAAPSINGFYANIDNTNIKNLVLLGLLNHYGANLYMNVD